MNKQEKVSFKRMDEGSASDYALLDEFETDYIKGLPDRIIHSLQRLDDTLGGYQVTRLHIHFNLQLEQRQMGQIWIDCCRTYS